MQKNQFGWFLIVTLVALRFGIGMHFFREGVDKIRDPKPFSAGFFSNAKGPFAPLYHNLVYDRDGQARLNLARTIQAWDQFATRVDKHYGFDANQKKRAEALKKRYEAMLREHFAVHADDIREFQGNIQRRNQYLKDPQRADVPSLRVQIDRIESDIQAKRKTLFPPIDAMWQSYALDLNAISTSEQRTGPLVQLSKPGQRLLDSDRIDLIIPWFDAAIGALLIMGLFTRVAAFAGAAFLFSVLVSQWPTAIDAMPTWPQFIEGLGLMVVGAASAGRWAGFDALLSALCCRCCNKKGTTR